MIALSTYAGRKVAVLGLARSGSAAVRALGAAGAEVIAWDDNAQRRTEHAGVSVQLTNLSSCDFDNVAALVLSPGVPYTHPKPHPAVVAARRAGVDVVGDVELFATAPRTSRIVGITGTNGKSTTTALIGHLLRTTGRAVEVGGNIGTPVLDLDPLDPEGVYVVELSSYQIDLAPSLVCDVAVLINISSDHLDRHGDMAGYVAVKRRIFSGQQGGQAAVVGVDDAYSRETYEWLKAQGHDNVVPIAVGNRVDDGVYVVDGLLHDEMKDDRATVSLDGIASLRGRHNWQNVAAAYAACRSLGLSRDDIAAALPSFPGLRHRMESVGVVDGVEYVNDSKATNADAAARALATFDEVFWIAGGCPKDGGYDVLVPSLAHVRKAYLIGEAAEAMDGALSEKVATSVCGTLAAAVAAAAEDAARAADEGASPVVLLSPACASFDQFADYEARGDAFRDLVSARKGAA